MEEKHETRNGQAIAAETVGLGDGLTEVVEGIRVQLGYLACNDAVTAILGQLAALDDLAEKVRMLEKHARHGDAVVMRHLVPAAE